MSLNIRMNTVIFVRLRGALTINTIRDLQKALKKHKKAQVVLDLAEIDEVDPTAIAELISANAQGGGHLFKTMNPSAQFNQIRKADALAFWLPDVMNGINEMFAV